MAIGFEDQASMQLEDQAAIRLESQISMEIDSECNSIKFVKFENLKEIKKKY